MFVADLSDYPQVRTAFEGIFTKPGGATEGSVTLPKALMTQCIAYLLRSLSGQSDSRLPWLPGLQNLNLYLAVGTIFEHPEAAHRVDSVADCALMSWSAFVERFRETLGSTPINFVHNLRIRKTAERRSNVRQVTHQVAKTGAIPLAPSKTSLASSPLRFGRANLFGRTAYSVTTANKRRGRSETCPSFYAYPV